MGLLATAQSGRRRPGLPLRPGLLAGLLLAAGCTALRVSSPLGPPRAGGAPAPPLEVAWRHDAGGGFGRTPALVTAEGVLVATRRGEVLLVDRDGRRLGSVAVGAAIEGPPALVGGRTLIVPVASGRFGLVALDLTAGTRTWRALRDVAVEAGVVVAGGNAVAPGLDGSVRAVEVRTGEARWTFEAPGRTAFRATPLALPDDRVLVADTRGQVTALDAGTGRVVWAADIGAPVEEAPAMGEGIVVVPTTRGRLVALDAVTGGIRWTFEAAHPYDRVFAPTIAGDALYVGSSDGGLYRLDLATGERRWRHETDGHVSAAPLSSGPIVFAGTLDDRLVAVDAATGVERWAFELPGRVKSAPVVFGALVLVPAEPGMLWAFRAAAPTLP